MALIECARQVHYCSIESTCGVGRAWQRVNQAIRRSLQEITLLELAGLGAEPVRFAALERQLRAARPERS
jgi:DNA-binding IscR family transcriptional regulator